MSKTLCLQTRICLLSVPLQNHQLSPEVKVTVPFSGPLWATQGFPKGCFTRRLSRRQRWSTWGLVCKPLSLHVLRAQVVSEDLSYKNKEQSSKEKSIKGKPGVKIVLGPQR